MALDSLELTGRAATHVGAVEGVPVLLHRDVAEPFLAMRAAARTEGIQLLPVSGYRDFGRQRQIWNGKFRGERELLGAQGEVLESATLAPAERVAAILAWSALPGASRHHWGTDFDLIDAAALAPAGRARLVPEEFAPGAVFERLDHWLARHAADYGFYRPYAMDRGGVRPEPWHLSHARTGQAALEALTEQVLGEALLGAGLEAEELVLGQLPQIYQRYVRNVDPVSAAALAAKALTPPSTPS
jgi:LAS superfamily LD-carboxypeptidase LdcB